MPLRINTNVPAISAMRGLRKADRENQNSLQRLATGSRVAPPGTDAAGYAIGERLRADVAGMKRAKSNAESAVSLVQVAEGGLNEQFNIAVRLRELAVLSASDTVSDVEREFLDQEFQALTSEFERIAQSTQMGRQKLLVTDGEKSYDILVGATSDPSDNINFKIDANTTASNLGLDSLSVTDKEDSADVLSTLDEALTELGRVRSQFGSVQARFFHAIDNIEVQTENLEEAKSRITDTDIAEETSKMVSSSILRDAAVGVLMQANSAPKAVLRLIG